jgi:hypothetical protein
MLDTRRANVRLEEVLAALPGKVGTNMREHLVATGRVEGVLVSPYGRRTSTVRPWIRVQVLHGVSGDRHVGPLADVDNRDDLVRHLLGEPKRSEEVDKLNLRHLTLVCTADSRRIANAMGLSDGLVPAGLQGENILASVDPALVPVGGSVMFMSESGIFRRLVLYVTAVNNPCGIPHSNIKAHYGPDFTPSAMYADVACDGHRGFTLIAKVAKKGGERIYVNDTLFVFRGGV